jgi:hypothetical protein
MGFSVREGEDDAPERDIRGAVERLAPGIGGSAGHDWRFAGSGRQVTSWLKKRPGSGL